MRQEKPAGEIRAFSCMEKSLFPDPEHEIQKNITMAVGQKMKGQKCHEVRFYIHSGQKRT